MSELLRIIIPPVSEFLEMVGVAIIIIGSVRAMYDLVVNKFNLANINLKLNLARSLELALEFKLAAEILKTVLIRTLDELVILSAIVVLRVIMTFVIHWEIKNTEKEDEK